MQNTCGRLDRPSTTDQAVNPAFHAVSRIIRIFILRQIYNFVTGDHPTHMVKVYHMNINLNCKLKPGSRITMYKRKSGLSLI